MTIVDGVTVLADRSQSYTECKGKVIWKIKAIDVNGHPGSMTIENETKPGEMEKTDWNRLEAMVMSKLTTYIGGSISNEVSEKSDSPFQLWKAIGEIFGTSDGLSDCNALVKLMKTSEDKSGSKLQYLKDFGDARSRATETGWKLDDKFYGILLALNLSGEEEHFKKIPKTLAQRQRHPVTPIPLPFTLKP